MECSSQSLRERGGIALGYIYREREREGERERETHTQRERERADETGI